MLNITYDIEDLDRDASFPSFPIIVRVFCVPRKIRQRGEESYEDEGISVKTEPSIPGLDFVNTDIVKNEEDFFDEGFFNIFEGIVR